MSKFAITKHNMNNYSNKTSFFFILEASENLKRTE